MAVGGYSTVVVRNMMIFPAVNTNYKDRLRFDEVIAMNWWSSFFVTWCIVSALYTASSWFRANVYKRSYDLRPGLPF